MLKPAIQGVLTALLVCAAFFAGGYLLNQKPPSKEPPKARETSIDGVTLPNGVTLNKRSSEEVAQSGVKIEGSSSSRQKPHPEVAPEQILQREVREPLEIKGKWKAVKLLIKDKTNEKANEFKVVELGSSFMLTDSEMKVTVGPFFPNFVMSENSFTSMNNMLINPAVHLTVEENDKEVYNGWAFSRYPNLYAFKHPRFGFQLTDFIPAGNA